jgi:hypothetical protein
MENRFELNDAEKFFLEEALLLTAEKYEKLRLQRLNATKKWNSSHRDKVNEYNKFYQRRLNAKKRENKEPIKNNNDPEKYKKYQAEYRNKRKLLKQLPFSNDV